MAGEHLDLTSESPWDKREPASESRPFLGVKFDCCSVYARIYIDADKTAYSGRCPRGGKAVRFQIGEGGSDSRFFRVS